MPEPIEQIKELEAILKELEASEHPDFETISDVQTQIDALRAGGGVGSGDSGGESPIELDTFDDWAEQSSSRYADPDQYAKDGEPQNFNSGVTPAGAEAEPAQKLETAPLTEPQGASGLSDEMEKVMNFLIENVVVKTYHAVTFKGKKKLPALVKAAAKSGGPGPVDRLSFSVKRGFEKAFGQLNYSASEKNQIIFELVLSLDDKIYAIEHRDVGASRILKSLIAKDHLPGELYKKLDKKGAFDH